MFLGWVDDRKRSVTAYIILYLESVKSGMAECQSKVFGPENRLG